MSGVKYFLITDFESMDLMGVSGLFTRQRLDGQSLPEGFYKYSIREARGRRFSSSKRDAFVKRVGDFISKTNLDLKGNDEYEIEEEYKFTHKKVDLDAFFGEDVMLRIAQELDAFVYDFDTHEYQDNAAGHTREDVVKSVRDGLTDKAYVAECIRYFENIQKADEKEHFLDGEMKQNIRRYVDVLTRINERNRDQLDRLIKIAEETKAKPAGNGGGKTPDGRQ